MADDTLPHSLEAERAVIGAALVNAATVDQSRRILQDGDWYRDAHRLIWRAILHVHDSGAAVDLVTVVDRLRAVDALETAGGAAYVSSCTDGVPKSTNATHYATLVASHPVRVQMARAATAGAEPAALDALAARLAKLQDASGKVRFLRAADIEPQAVPWLWRKRLARGEVTVISGDPGAGKSLAAVDVCANLTAGFPLPDDPETDREPLTCAWIGHSSEDSPARTIVPRFIAAGGDLERLHVLDTGQGDVTLAAACDALADLGVDVAVVDSWAAFGADAARDTGTEAAERYRVFDGLRVAGAAILIITHDRKGDVSDSVQAVAGSAQTVAKPRTVLHVKGGELRCLKGNLAGRADTLAFMVEGTTVTHRGQTFSDVPRLEWDSRPIPVQSSPGTTDDGDPGVTVDDVVECVTAAGEPLTRSRICRELNATGKRRRMLVSKLVTMALAAGRLESSHVTIKGRSYDAVTVCRTAEIEPESERVARVATSGATRSGATDHERLRPTSPTYRPTLRPACRRPSTTRSASNGSPTACCRRS